MFRDREEAGQRLAIQLKKKMIGWDFKTPETLVIALPRGGVPVANEVAKKLNFDLDILAVKKIGHPGNPEYALGAVSEDGVYYYNPMQNFDTDVLDELKENSFQKALKQAKLLRQGRPPPSIEGKNIILVDDGIATGSTVSAAIKLIRKRGANKIVLAVPVASPQTVEKLSTEVDHLVVLETPVHLSAVAQSYYDFTQVSDSEVTEILSKAS